MDGVGSGPSIQTQVYAMKKAVEVQEDAVLKIIESAMQQTQQVDKAEVAKINETGQKIDLMA